MNTNFKRVIGPVLVLAAVGVAAPGCGDDILGGDNPLCCNEGDFQVGGSIEFEGSAEVGVTLQAVADISGIASAMVDDLTTSCRAMAEELDAPADQRAAADANKDKRARMEAWCELAVTAIADVKARAGGSISVDFQPPQCSASVSAKANCQAGCSASAECDIKANPPTCEGGKLEVACKGSCEAKAGATLTCTGSCTGTCEGSCTVETGGVECAGKCEGTCKGEAEGGTGTGIQADGTCNGTCEGTCEVTAPGAECSGTCSGECSASCEGSAEASVTCDGECTGDFEPLKCEGGELSGGCQVDAKCEANCDASVKAKAECTPPSIEVVISGGADIALAGKLKAVLEANLGIVVAMEARLSGMLDATAVVAGNINAEFLADVKVACIPVIAAAALNAVTDVEASATASLNIIGTATGN